jgi:hypothetical protein
MMGGVMLALIAGLLPAALAAGLVGLVIYTVTAAVPIVMPALVLAMTMIGECWLAAGLLGRVLDRTDVSAVEAIE